jgi:hypothetical protein
MPGPPSEEGIGGIVFGGSDLRDIEGVRGPEWLRFDYMAGEVSFKVVLLRTRLSRSVRAKSSAVRWRNCRRAASRMVQFLEKLGGNDWTYRTGGWQVEVRRLNITNIVLLYIACQTIL